MTNNHIFKKHSFKNQRIKTFYLSSHLYYKAKYVYKFILHYYHENATKKLKNAFLTFNHTFRDFHAKEIALEIAVAPNKILNNNFEPCMVCIKLFNFSTCI